MNKKIFGLFIIILSLIIINCSTPEDSTQTPQESTSVSSDSENASEDSSSTTEQTTVEPEDTSSTPENSEHKLSGAYKNSDFGIFTFYDNGTAKLSKTYGIGNNFKVYQYDNNRILCSNTQNSSFFFKFKASSDYSKLYQLNTDWSEPTSKIIWYKQ